MFNASNLLKTEKKLIIGDKLCKNCKKNFYPCHFLHKQDRIHDSKLFWTVHSWNASHLLKTRKARLELKQIWKGCKNKRKANCNYSFFGGVGCVKASRCTAFPLLKDNLFDVIRIKEMENASSPEFVDNRKMKAKEFGSGWNVLRFL